MPVRWWRMRLALASAVVLVACASPRADGDAAIEIDAPSAPALLAAARTADITPAPGAIIVGFGSRTSTSVRDPLEAAVIVVRAGRSTFALVTVDLPGIFERHASLVRGLVASRIGADHED